MNLLNIYSTNRICPRCKNPNYMVSLNGVSDVFQYKCFNCNSYFTYEDFTSRTSTIKKDLVEVVRCKDCKKHGDYDCHITSLTGQTSADDWFCADGKRADNKNEGEETT